MGKFAYLIAMLAITSPFAILPARTQDTGAANSPHVIEVTAKTFEFIPNEIHVKVGERVQIKLHTADRAHGIKLDLYPEGASQDGPPGLVFDHPQDDAKVEKHKDRDIEFVAARAGTYDFKCSVQCSMMGHGHDRMTGKLIVEE
ncbi:MAG TPA: cupredoxin domain-containing protein [Candidatus Saccharimonadales bacterium]|jgi:heme/copper-type cytochrome/quinol oxidase subunit 2|nr:cupredoxin domain-containing protein [Candidatus Saccharimonadales bacterium]